MRRTTPRRRGLRAARRPTPPGHAWRRASCSHASVARDPSIAKRSSPKSVARLLFLRKITRARRWPGLIAARRALRSKTTSHRLHHGQDFREDGLHRSRRRLPLGRARGRRRADLLIGREIVRALETKKAAVFSLRAMAKVEDLWLLGPRGLRARFPRRQQPCAHALFHVKYHDRDAFGQPESETVRTWTMEHGTSAGVPLRR